jgi:hypothetical protein
MTKIQQASTQSIKPKSLSLTPIKQDASAAAALNKLAAENKGKGSISGEEMSKAILDATKDPDNQAAGKEFDAIKKFVKANPEKLSPEAKKVFEVYSREATRARAAGQTGIDFRVYNSMQREMQAVAKPNYKDVSTGKALNELAANNKKAGSISGREMAEALLKGTKDLDGKSATKEFQDVEKFVKENAQLLSPEAKKVFETYSKAAKAAQAKGQSGIPQSDYNRMARDMMRAGTPNYKDLSAGKQLEALAANNKEPGSISGKEMMDAVIKGTQDLDGKAATTEFKDIQKFVRENEQLLSPEAKAVFATYEKTVKGAKNGQIGLKDFMKMQGEMAKVASPKHADKSMGAALDSLAAGNKAPGSISGNEMVNALISGARDYDGQAAGAEFRDAAKFVKENGQLLSPEAKAAFGVYQKYAAAAQAKGQAGIDPKDFARMSLEMQRAGAPRYGDQSTAQALNGLAAGNKTPGSISGREMEQAILSGTRDLDNQAAGKEFADVAKFVKENAQLLSPQAKQTFAIYEKYAKAAQAKGQTGIPQGEFTKMQLEMSSLNKPHFPAITPAAQIATAAAGAATSGAQVGAAVNNALQDIANTFGQLGSILPGSPQFPGVNEALAQVGAQLSEQLMNGIADKLVAALNEAFVKLSGQPTSEKDPLNLGEALADFKKEMHELFNPGKPVAPPPLPRPKPRPFIRPDASAAAAVKELLANNKTPGSISGREMTEAIIKGTADLDNQAAGKEFAAFKKMVNENPALLSPEAKKAFAVYEQHARAAQSKGQTGIPMGDYLRMQTEMRSVSGPVYKDVSAGKQLEALAAGNKQPGSISGKEMVDAIIQGTIDKDNQAAGKEYADIKKFVNENSQLLSPEAKKAFAVYESHVNAAKARGQTGIDLRDFARMEVQLQNVGRPAYQDASMGQTLNALAAGNKQPGSISGQEMTDAILKGTRDLDNQAAGKEFADVAKFVKENEQLLSPEAKKAFAVYEKHANAAKAKGQTGIPLGESLRMGAEMRQVSSPQYNDASAAKQLNALAAGNKQPGSISGQEMANAIYNGIKDLDGKAATTELKDIQKFVRENEQLLSPEAKRAFAAYERAASDGKITTGDLEKLRTTMNRVGQPSYQDSSAAAALKDLAGKNKTPGSISPNEMRDAILRGTRDPDSQAAGKEFADFAKFVKENEQLLSPGAKKVFAAYEKAAKAAQAKGQTGIGEAEYTKMSREMMLLSLFK